MPVRVNLGCGDQRMPGAVGLDRLKRAGTDVICDLEVGIPLVDNSAEHVRAESLLEHIDELEYRLQQMIAIGSLTHDPQH